MDVKAIILVLHVLQTVSQGLSLGLRRKPDIPTFQRPLTGGNKLKWKSSHAIKDNPIQDENVAIKPSAPGKVPSRQKEYYRTFSTGPSDPFYANQTSRLKDSSSIPDSPNHPGIGLLTTVDQPISSDQTGRDIHNPETQQLSSHPLTDAIQNLYVFISLLVTILVLVCMCGGLHFYKSKGCVKECYRNTSCTKFSAKQEPFQYAALSEDTKSTTFYKTDNIPELVIRSTAQTTCDLVLV